MPKSVSINHNWKGVDAGYVAIHDWVNRHFGSPDICEHCNTNKSKKFEWSNKSGKYIRNRSDWQRLCTSCHKLYDLAKLGKRAGYKTHCIKGHEYNKNNTARHRSTGFVYCKECNRIRARINRVTA